jgi:hypothetical protein
MFFADHAAAAVFTRIQGLNTSTANVRVVYEFEIEIEIQTETTKYRQNETTPAMYVSQPGDVLTTEGTSS